MNYIKTKDGIYEVLEEHQLPVGDDTYYVTACKNFYSYEVLSKATSIQELCDYVFLFDKEITVRKITHEDDDSLIEWLKECIELEMKVKLAILTDKGLIYVAKMDERGELELL